MAEIKVPIQVNLPDDWVEQIVDRLRNDPDAEWVEIIRCKDCKWYDITHPYGTINPDAYHCKTNDRFYGGNHFCAYGERKNDEERT